MRSDRERLLDILEAIDKIQSHQGKTRSSFNSNDLLQVWAVHYLQIIGEAASRLSDEIREQYLDIQWGANYWDAPRFSTWLFRCGFGYCMECN